MSFRAMRALLCIMVLGLQRSGTRHDSPAGSGAPPAQGSSAKAVRHPQENKCSTCLGFFSFVFKLQKLLLIYIYYLKK